MRCSVNRLLQLATKPRLQSMRSDTSSQVWPSASSKISRARRASSARSVRLLARRVSSISSEFDNVMASLMDAIIVYKWLLQSTSSDDTSNREHWNWGNAHADATDERAGQSGRNSDLLAGRDRHNRRGQRNGAIDDGAEQPPLSRRFRGDGAASAGCGVQQRRQPAVCRKQRRRVYLGLRGFRARRNAATSADRPVARGGGGIG